MNKTYMFSELKKLLSVRKIKSFTVPLNIKATGKPFLCQIKSCKDNVAWFVMGKKGKQYGLCFGHGEEI